ncbi:MAG: hypothetical protein AB1656_16220 [Candidatus Omnitrophota bacterium]
MKRYFFLTLFILLVHPAWSAEEAKPKESKDSGVEMVYRIQVRVIYAGKTGIFGTVPTELSDMRQVLTQYMPYPSYELSNIIRLSVFGDEEATALTFPEHYLRIIPKGAIKGERGLKVKAELYHVPAGVDSKTKYWLGNPQQQNPTSTDQGSSSSTAPSTTPPMIGFEEKSQGESKPFLPIVSSAVLLTDRDWEAFGGVPIRVNSKSEVSSTSMSSSSLSLSAGRNSVGMERFLILGMRLEKQ